MLIHTFKGHTGEVYSAEYSPCGKYIPTVSSDGTMRIWDSETGKLISIIEVD